MYLKFPKIQTKSMKVFQVSEKDFVELSFRFRPKVHTPDGILVRYLLSCKPNHRRRMILTALRTFYMMAAYGWVSDIEDLEGASELLEVLKKTYGAGKENIVNNSISLNIDLRMDYMGATLLEGIDSFADEDEDDYDSE
jgi:hypothetical protein